MTSNINDRRIADVVRFALKEDIGTGDISATLLPKNMKLRARAVSRENALICGVEYFNEAFLQLDNDAQISWHIKAGDIVHSQTNICTIYAQARALLSAERTALNFLQTLSATATQTHFLLDKIKHTKATLLDTRKTLPNLRTAQKLAVLCAGGMNHRQGLFDAVMLKENHINALGGLDPAIKQAKKKYPDLSVIVEVENILQLKKVLAYEGNLHILCDNFTPAVLREAVKLNQGKHPLEASGGIDIHNIKVYAETGVNYISVGSITKNIKAIDLSIITDTW